MWCRKSDAEYDHGVCWNLHQLSTNWQLCCSFNFPTNIYIRIHLSLFILGISTAIQQSKVDLSWAGLYTCYMFQPPINLQVQYKDQEILIVIISVLHLANLPWSAFVAEPH